MGHSWFDWSYGTYLLVLVDLILALSLGTAGLTVFLSQYSGHYIAMLLKAVPLFVVVGAVLGSWLLDMPLHSATWATAPSGCPGASRPSLRPSFWHWGWACVSWHVGGRNGENCCKCRPWIYLWL